MAKRSKKKKANGGKVSVPAMTTGLPLENEKLAKTILHQDLAPSGEVGQTVPLGMAPPRSHDLLWGLPLVLAVVLVYLPLWQAGFIWDDEKLVTTNPYIIGPLGLKGIWTTSIGRFCPLVFTTFWVEHALWRLAPLPYHVVNVLMHGASAVLLWRVLRILQIPGAWLGAALWALHPVEVESVAWISEMKNTESGVFFLLTILFFARWLKSREINGRKGDGRNYTWSLLFAALAMASKSSTVILPIVLSLCVWWLEGRWRWRNLITIGPVFLMSLIASALTMWTPDLQGIADAQSAQNWPQRLATAGVAIWFYLGKLFWPHPLMAVYPRWKIDTEQWFSYLPLLAVIITLLILWLKRKSWSRPWFFIFVYFLAALLPVLGFINMLFSQYSYVADHFQYLASMGPLALVGAGLVRLGDFVLPGKSKLQKCLCAGLLLILGGLSWQRTWAYENEETLWTDTLAKNPNCWAGYTNLGAVRLRKGEIDKAIDLFHKGLGINPYNAEAYNNLGFALFQKGQMNEAVAQFQKALKISPRYAEAHNNLGNVLLQNGQIEKAIVEYKETLELDPFYASPHNNFGYALFQNGQTDDAIEQYKKALAIRPDYAEAHNNLGFALAQKGEVDAAIGQYQKALEINPNSAKAHNNLGVILAQKGQIDEAIEQYEKTLKIDPDNVEAHNNLGNVLARKGSLDEAIEQYQKALKIDPNYTKAYNNFGFALFQKGRVDEAIKWYQKVLAITPNYALAHFNLGLALVKEGKLDEGITQFQKALELKPDFPDAQTELAKAQAMPQDKPSHK